ncbi:M48 family metallopeptidase [Serinibacter arcticus]|uniref:M48 metallopeptidase family protein n=1 Tax=Serinibacter arcticus TaxID=1655435 RepID=UPI001F15AC1F|nr:M48 family metallopeptidase [Serinibacter arcticus]
MTSTTAATTPPGPGAPEIEVRRSRRRTRTVTAFRENGRIVVAIPARFSPAQEAEWVEKMLARLAATERRRRPSDAALAARAAALSERYLEGRARPTSVAWVTNMRRRWGSATRSTGEIRLSHVLQGMPEWVLDGVLVHELAHLVEANHGPRFRELAWRYPRQTESEAFLAGVTWAQGHGVAGDGVPDDDGGAEDDLEPEPGGSRAPAASPAPAAPPARAASADHGAAGPPSPSSSLF